MYKNIFSNPNLKIFLSLNLLLTFFYFFFTNILEAIKIFSVSDLVFSTSFKIKLFFITLFDYSNISNLSTLILVTLSILFSSLLFTQFFILWKKTKEISPKKSFWSFLGLFLAVLGLHCITCGATLLFSILSLFGIVSITKYLPLAGQEFGYLGLIMIIIMNFILYKRIKSPTTC